MPRLKRELRTTRRGYLTGYQRPIRVYVRAYRNSEPYICRARRTNRRESFHASRNELSGSLLEHRPVFLRRVVTSEWNVLLEPRVPRPSDFNVVTRTNVPREDRNRFTDQFSLTAVAIILKEIKRRAI